MVIAPADVALPHLVLSNFVEIFDGLTPIFEASLSMRLSMWDSSSLVLNCFFHV